MINSKEEINDRADAILYCINQTDFNEDSEIQKISHLLQEMVVFYDCENKFDPWVKDCLVSAIGALSSKWLHLTLVCIRHSTIEERSAQYPLDKKRAEAIEQLTKSDFIKAIDGFIKK